MMPQKSFSLIAIIALTTCLLVSCGERKVYDKYAHTPLSGWEKTDTLLYNIPAIETTGTYQLSLGLRVANNFPFTALTLIVEHHILPADSVVCDTLRCTLTDDKGNFSGKGLNCYQYNFHVADLSLQQGDSLHIRVRHDMKREVLPGISEVGMTLSCE